MQKIAGNGVVFLFRVGLPIGYCRASSPELSSAIVVIASVLASGLRTSRNSANRRNSRWLGSLPLGLREIDVGGET